MLLKQVLLGGKPAYKLKAILKRTSLKAGLYDLEGLEKWVPDSVSKFTLNEIEGSAHTSEDIEGAILILDWWYEKEIVSSGKDRFANEHF